MTRRVMTFGVKWVIPALLLLGAIACSVALGVEDANPPIVAVQGDSMRPALSNGDLVIVRGVTPSSLRVGDVVAVAVPTAIQARDGLPPHIEHKIVAIERTGPRIGFITKGDANPGPDPFVVRPSEIVGEVVGSVPLLGYVFLFFGSVPGDVALALVFMAAAVYFVARRRERRRACLQQLASTIVALREDADEIRSALFTSPPAPRAATAASPEQPRVSEELGHAVSALEELVTEVRSTSDQNRDSAAMLRELVGAVSEYGVHLRSHTAVMRNLAVTTDQLQEAASRLADAMTSPTAQLRPAGPQRPQRHLGTTQRRPEAFETSRTPLGTSRMDPDAQLWREPFSAADLRWPNLPRTAGGYFTEPVNRLLDRAADALELVERERNSMRERLLVVETRLAILTQQQQASTQQRISAQRDAFELDARERHDAMLALQEASRRASDIVREIEDERTRLLEIARELGVQLLAAGRSFGEAAANEVVPERPSTTPAQAPLPSRRSAGPAVAPSAPTSAPVGPPLPWVPATTPAPSRPGATSPPGGSPGGSSAAPSADGGVHAPGPGMPPVWEVTPPPTR